MIGLRSFDGLFVLLVEGMVGGARRGIALCDFVEDVAFGIFFGRMVRHTGGFGGVDLL